MNNKIWPTILLALLLPASWLAGETPGSKAPLLFDRDVRPILKAYCFDCHGGGEKLQGGLDTRLVRFLQKGGEAGPALKPGAPEASLFLKRITAGEMPPGEKKVPLEQQHLLKEWVAQGARTDRVEPEKLPLGFEVSPQEQAYWFFQPIRRVAPKSFGPADRVRTPIDAFVLEKLRAKGLSFQEDADKRTLLLRVSFGLTGLPPTEEEAQAFLNDSSEQAYEKLVDRLLASPHFGERWARHWLDVAGYADSDGDGVNDSARPYAWRYRDYVIRAFNADKPLNQFVIEQLAGDELTPRPWTNLSPEKIDTLAATGFLRTAPLNMNGLRSIADANQVAADTLKIVSSSLLGLTVGCAQCHDHRYDPIPQTDYFRLRAIFEPGFLPNVSRGANDRQVTLYTDADRAKAAKINEEANRMQAAHDEKQRQAVRKEFLKELEKFPADQRSKLQSAFETPADKKTAEQKQLVATTPKLNIDAGVLYQYNQAAADELKASQEKINAKRAEIPAEEFVDLFHENPGVAPPTHLFYRGDYRQPRSVIGPADLTILASSGQRWEPPAQTPGVATTGRRLAFAKHLTNGQHPLFGRVLANRLWLGHFGRGIVPTPGDFGFLGQRPTHPELLDWLASELPIQGWRLKSVCKMIVMSTTYRQTSRRTPVLDRADADNALYGRWSLRRLEGEILRDRLLVTAGRLDRTLFGKPIPVAEDFVGQVITPDDRPRRSIYLEVRRTRPVAFLTAFDMPTGELNCDRRQSSTVAPQSLMMMNSDFALQQAGHFANRIRNTPATEKDRQLARSVNFAFSRPRDAWRFGYGAVDADAKKVSRFEPFTTWTGSAWQVGKQIPDPKAGFAFLTAGGGHAGANPDFQVIRRWIAPRDGVVAVTGSLSHPSPNGDGVRGRLVSSRNGRVGEWLAKSKATPTAATTIAVNAGDSLDFVVDCVGDVNSDSFDWPVQITLKSGSETANWNSQTDFGPTPTSLPELIVIAWRMAYLRTPTAEELEQGCRFVDRMMAGLRGAGQADPEGIALTTLCQQLVASNEFLYVD